MGDSRFVVRGRLGVNYQIRASLINQKCEITQSATWDVISSLFGSVRFCGFQRFRRRTDTFLRSSNCPSWRWLLLTKHSDCENATEATMAQQVQQTPRFLLCHVAEMKTNRATGECMNKTVLLLVTAGWEKYGFGWRWSLIAFAINRKPDAESCGSNHCSGAFFRSTWKLLMHLTEWVGFLQGLFKLNVASYSRQGLHGFCNLCARTRRNWSKVRGSCNRPKLRFLAQPVLGKHWLESVFWSSILQTFTSFSLFVCLLWEEAAWVPSSHGTHFTAVSPIPHFCTVCWKGLDNLRGAEQIGVCHRAAHMFRIGRRRRDQVPFVLDRRMNRCHNSYPVLCIRRRACTFAAEVNRFIRSFQGNNKTLVCWKIGSKQEANWSECLMSDLFLSD